mmetsp:Transcript_38069/g.52858  ORF Transcript_38069/g.52858 Transcript_38069/m.52858 type:complete len:241 (+) Transcript_38069:17-739(+)
MSVFYQYMAASGLGVLLLTFVLIWQGLLFNSSTESGAGDLAHLRYDFLKLRRQISVDKAEVLKLMVAQQMAADQVAQKHRFLLEHLMQGGKLKQLSGSTSEAAALEAFLAPGHDHTSVPQHAGFARRGPHTGAAQPLSSSPFASPHRTPVKMLNGTQERSFHQSGVEVKGVVKKKMEALAHRHCLRLASALAATLGSCKDLSTLDKNISKNTDSKSKKLENTNSSLAAQKSGRRGGRMFN